jgi:ribonuclease P protein component
MRLHTFVKKERLKAKKWIELLFSQGHTLQLQLVRLYYLPYHIHAQHTHQVLFSVPKKNLKKAIWRNTIKRRLREAYRLSKYQIKNTHLHFLIGYVYTGKNIEQAAYTALLADVQHTLNHLQQQVSTNKLQKVISPTL